MRLKRRSRQSGSRLARIIKVSDLQELKGQLQKSLAGLPGFESVGIYHGNPRPGLIINFDESTVRANFIPVERLRDEVGQKISRNPALREITYKIQLLGKLKFQGSSLQA